MDIGKAFTYVFDDEEWLKKLALGGIIAFIPILNFAAFGYLVEVVKNVRNGDEHPLPDWGEGLGQFFMDGVMIFVAMLIYSLPVILLGCIFGVLSAMLGSAMENGSDVAGIVMGISTFCLMGGMIVLGFLPYLILPAALVRFAETKQLGAMLKFGDLWAFAQQNLGGYIIVLLLSGLVMSFIAPLGLILCLIGVFFTQWWAYLVFGHLTGQLWRSNELQV